MRPLAIACLAFALGACTVGPDFVRPEAPLPGTFDQAQAPLLASGEVGTAVWQAFGEPELDALITRALEQNTDLQQSLARLNEARAIAGLAFYALIPSVRAEAGAERSKPSGRDPFIPPEIGTTETWRAGFDASWEIDLFGSARRAREAAFRDVEAAEAALEAARLSVVAETAQAWFALRGAQTLLALRERQVENLRQNITLLREQLEAGRGTELDVTRSNALGLVIAARLPEAEAEVVRHEQRLAVLTRQPVAELRAQLAPGKALPELPQLVNTGTPQEWLARRPDVREAEKRLAAEVARVGFETAELYPKLTLTGGFGGTAQSSGDVFDSAAERWRFGPTLSWSFLDFGRIRQDIRAQQARADGALVAWESTLLRALEETENAFATLRAANRSGEALAMAVTAARRSHELAKLRFEAGAGDFLAVLDAERTLIDIEEQHTQNATARATALAAVYKALAGDFAAVPAKP